MRDYENIPILDWTENNTVINAKAKILLQEPVILQMPDEFDTSADGNKFGCKLQEDTGILRDCDGGKILQQLASQNQLTTLITIAEACVESSSQVDIDGSRKLIIVHN